MGLLGKAIAINAHTGSGSSRGGVTSSVASGGDSSGGVIRSFIDDFHYKNPQFHGIVFQGSEAYKSEDVYDMLACHGGAVADLPGGNSLVLLPGALDRELFAHRLCHSAGLTTLSQMSVDSPSLALEALSPYLR
jgi:hypothetical protein